MRFYSERESIDLSPKEERFIHRCHVVARSINRSLFDYKLVGMPILLMSEAIPRDLWDIADAAIGTNCILIHDKYVDAYRTETLINLFFHELCHRYCTEHHINDVQMDGEIQYHTKSFGKVVEQHGGIARKAGEYGYIDTRLRKDAMMHVIDAINRDNVNSKQARMYERRGHSTGYPPTRR